MDHPELPLFSFLSAILVLIPLPWHWRAKNVATLSLIAWLFTVDVIYAINSIIWAGNVHRIIPVWCDITTKIVVGASYALPISTACICKHLELVASGRKISFSYTDRRRRMIFEAVLCIGLPLVFMALHFIVQGHRFDIIENTGCRATVYVSIPAIFIVWLPQLLFSVVTMVYAVAALYHFVRQRMTFAPHLRSSDTALTASVYLRLIAMVVTEMLWGTVLTSLNMHYNVKGRLQPWTNWNDVHYNFSRIDVYPDSIIPPEFRRVMMLLWWAIPVSSLIFFLFFGFGEEAKKEYTKVWQWCSATSSRNALLAKKEAIGCNPSSSKVATTLLSFFSNFKPSQLLHKRSHSTTKFPPISDPILLSSSNPSIPVLLASSRAPPNESQIPQPDTTEGGAPVDSSDTLTVSTFSVYAQPYGLRNSYRSSVGSFGTPVGNQPPQLPEIPLSAALSGSPPSSPAFSVPESVGSTFYKSPLGPQGGLPSPASHRASRGTSMYAVARPSASAQQGIHRQASADEVV